MLEKAAMAVSDTGSAAPGPSSAPALKDSQPGAYDHLPDLSADLSMDATTNASARPTFEQLNATLISRGYLRMPLNVAGMREESLAALADALHAMIAQREEDIEVRTALTAKNRTLTASLERTKRFQKEGLERSADFERKAEASKSKLAHLTTQLETERNAHKATKEALGRLRRDLQAIKSSTLQYKAANDRSVARVRARIGEVTSSAIRSAVPDFQIVASAFDDLPAASSSKAGAAGLYASQVQELEQKRAHLVEYNQALKRLATEAINAARQADQELVDMLEAEQDDAEKRESTSTTTTKINIGVSETRSASSGSLSSNSTSKRSSPAEVWLDGHRPLFQRDLFPANDNLRSTASGLLVSGSSSKNSHPALRALEFTSAAISAHVQSLLDLRSDRTVRDAALSQRLSTELREQAWLMKLEQDVHEDLQNDARLSLNKTNGPVHVGSLASAAIAASSGSSGGGASYRVDWQREKAEMEKKLAQLVKQVAIAEQNATRKDKEVKKLAEAEKHARSLLDQVSSATAAGKDVGTTQIPDMIEQVDSLKAALQTAEKERALFAQRCEMLEAEAREIRNERDRILSGQALREDPSHSATVTSLRRLNDGEVAEIHARDQKRRNDLGSLSIVEEDVEMPSLTSTVETAETDFGESHEFSTSRRSSRKGRDSSGHVDVAATSFGESFGNNPELDAIFGISKPPPTKPTRASEAAPRRSSRLSGGSAAADATPSEADVEFVALKDESHKRKADKDVPLDAVEKVEEQPTGGNRRSSGRVSGGGRPKANSNEAAGQRSESPRPSKRSRAEQSTSLESLPADAAVVPRSSLDVPLREAAAQPRRRLSTREKQELDQRQKQPRAVSTSNAAVPTKTPALSSRRIVSGSSSSVTRPTAASLRRSEAVQTTTAKRPLSNATNTRETTAPPLPTSKVQASARAVSSSASVRARS